MFGTEDSHFQADKGHCQSLPFCVPQINNSFCLDFSAAAESEGCCCYVVVITTAKFVKVKALIF